MSQQYSFIYQDLELKHVPNPRYHFHRSMISGLLDRLLMSPDEADHTEVDVLKNPNIPEADVVQLTLKGRVLIRIIRGECESFLLSKIYDEVYRGDFISDLLIPGGNKIFLANQISKVTTGDMVPLNAQFYKTELRHIAAVMEKYFEDIGYLDCTKKFNNVPENMAIMVGIYPKPCTVQISVLDK